MPEATITSKGQVTIPKEIREYLDLKEGEEIVFIKRGDEVSIRPKIKDPVKELRKLREKLPRITEKEIDEMIKESKEAWK